MSRRSAAVVLLFLVLAAIAAIAYSCWPRPRPGKPLTPVSVRMKWLYAGTMAPWFAGVDQGFFRDAGIDLVIHPGGPDNNAVVLVASGSDTFGIAGADEVLMARQRGVPIVAVGVIFKESPIAFISKPSRAVTTPADWTDKIVEVSYGSNAEFQYRALKAKFGAQPAKEVPYTFSLAPFIEDKVDVSVAYVMDQVVTLRRSGIDVRVLSAASQGINPYGDVVIVREDTLRDRPDLVRAFANATWRSFRWSIDNEDAAVASLVEAAPTLKPDNEREVWRASIPLVLGPDTPELVGRMESARWVETWNLVKQFGGSDRDIDLNAAYSNLPR